MARRKSRSRRIAGSVLDKLIVIGIVFMATPYLQAALTPVRNKLPQPDTVGGGSDTLDLTGPLKVTAQPIENIDEIVNQGVAPTGTAPVKESPVDIGAVAGPLGGIFLGS